MQQKYTFIKTNKKYIKLFFDDISYIKSLGNYVEVFTISNTKYIYYKSLKELIDKLPVYFMRVHNSYIINIVHLNSIEDNHIHINDIKISIGKSY